MEKCRCNRKRNTEAWQESVGILDTNNKGQGWEGCLVVEWCLAWAKPWIPSAGQGGEREDKRLNTPAACLCPFSPSCSSGFSPGKKNPFQEGKVKGSTQVYTCKCGSVPLQEYGGRDYCVAICVCVLTNSYMPFGKMWLKAKSSPSLENHTQRTTGN